MNDIERIKQLAGITTSSNKRPLTESSDAEEWARNLFKDVHVAEPHQTRVKRAPVAAAPKRPKYEPEPLASPTDKHADLKAKMAALDKLIDLKKQQEALVAKAEKWGPLPADVRFQMDDSHFPARDMEGKIEKAQKAISVLSDYMAMKRKLYTKKSRPMYETAPPGMEDVVMDLKKQHPGQEEKAFATAWSIYNKKHGIHEQEVVFSLDDEFGDEFGDGFDDAVEPRELMDIADDTYNDLVNRGMGHAEASAATCDKLMRNYGIDRQEAQQMVNSVSSVDTIMGETTVDDQCQPPSERIRQFYQLLNIYEPDQAFNMATDGMGDDEVVGFRAELEEQTRVPDFNNGYDEQYSVCGDDYFPNGATSPVVKKVGPSGARQGDNPESKAMEIAETREQLELAYQRYLKG